MTSTEHPVVGESGQATQGTLAVDDGFLAYEIQGVGPDVVLLHGRMMDSGMWAETRSSLASEYRVTTFDFRGHGKSSQTTGDWSNTDDFAQLAKHLGLQSAVLVGLSYGGRNAIDITLAHPDLVGGLVLAAPGLSGWNYTDAWNSASTQRMVDAYLAGDREDFIDAFDTGWVVGPRRSPAAVSSALRHDVGLILGRHFDAHQKFAGSPIEQGGIDRLSEITVPTLLVVGDADGEGIHDIADIIERDLRGCRRRDLPGVGHILTMEATAEFERLLRGFLAEGS